MQTISLFDRHRISEVLDRHLEAAKNKDVFALLQAFVPDGFFFGTDDTERWSVEELAKRLQESDHGWDMTHSSERGMWSTDPDDCSVESVHFLELITHTERGAMRGSGVVVKQGKDWKIACYILSFSIRNEVADSSSFKLLQSP